MDVPEPWLVEPVEAVADLDNVLLSEGDELSARFQLEALLVTGNALDLTSLGSGHRSAEIHPRGVQLELLPSGKEGRDGTGMVDTLIMSNLGYFQLKASPGLWTLQLAQGGWIVDGAMRCMQVDLSGFSIQSTWCVGQKSRLLTLHARRHLLQSPGRSRELFSLDDSRAVPYATPVAVDSLMGRHVALNVRKDPARLLDDVLDAQASAGRQKKAGMWSSLTSAVKSPAAIEKTSDERIHVFTVASGHM